MMRTLAVALMAVAVGAGTVKAGSGKIKHIVLLMEENRSFDHMCGFFPGVNGLKGNETNPYNTTDPNSPVVTVSKDSPYVGPFDPDHGLDATTDKVFGQKGIQEGKKVAYMDGFVEWEYYNKDHPYPESVMQMFTPDRLPVMYNLSQEFNLFDRYFCSIPGPTWPNRIFQLMGTSQGDTSTSHGFNPKTGIYFGKTIFDQVESVGLDWKFYFAEAPLEMAMIEKILVNPQNVHDMEQFRKDAREGSLPAFSWMNPRWFVNTSSWEGSNDQHPDHDVRLGEALMKDVYEELRAGPAWNNTLFIITYDEHGGFFDHVPTPLNIPAPDDWKSSPGDFDFKRSGVRIPTLMISPWVKKGRVISTPHGPANNSEFELTSVLSTMKNMYGFEDFLTKRDAWAAPFDEYIDEEEPRTDCPMKLPHAPKSLGKEHAMREAAQPLNHLQQDIVAQFARVRGEHELTRPENLPKLQGEASEWISQIVADLKAGLHILNKDKPALDADVECTENCDEEN